MKAGARAKKDSLPMAQICFPVMFCQGCIATPARENSPMAQCSQWATAASDHCLGSEISDQTSSILIPSILPKEFLLSEKLRHIVDRSGTGENWTERVFEMETRRRTETQSFSLTGIK